MNGIFHTLPFSERSGVIAMRGQRRPTALPERRRSPRWGAYVPVFVYGYAGDDQPFHEVAYSRNVSTLGALLVMRCAVQPGERLLITNKVTLLDQECRIAHVASCDLQTMEVAVEFRRPVPDFWRLIAGRLSVSARSPGPNRSTSAKL